MYRLLILCTWFRAVPIVAYTFDVPDVIRILLTFYEKVSCIEIIINHFHLK